MAGNLKSKESHEEGAKEAPRKRFQTCNTQISTDRILMKRESLQIVGNEGEHELRNNDSQMQSPAVCKLASSDMDKMHVVRTLVIKTIGSKLPKM